MCILTKRATKRRTDTAIIRSWRSQDGRYSLQEVQSIFGLPTEYLAVQVYPGGGQVILSRPRKRLPAERALDSFATSR